jgi:hypothetical protein
MITVHQFFKKFEETPKDRRFQMVEAPGEATSLFVIFQRIQQARAQKRYFEDVEAHLLKQAEEVLTKINNG